MKNDAFGARGASVSATVRWCAALAVSELRYCQFSSTASTRSPERSKRTT